MSDPWAKRYGNGCSLSTSQSLSLAGTSRVDHVNLYGFNKLLRLILSKHHSLWSFDPSVIEIDRNRERLWARKVPVSLNPYAIVVGESQERLEQREKKRGVVYFFPSTRHGKRRGIRKSDTQRTRVLKLLVGYHSLGALNALRHP